MANNPDHYARGVIVGGNDDAEKMDLIRNRGQGVITSPYPKDQCVTVRWKNGRSELWHVDLLEVIDRPER